MGEQHDRPGDAFTREDSYARTRRPVAPAEMLTPEACTSERFFALERDRMFASHRHVHGLLHEPDRAGHRRGRLRRAPRGDDETARPMFERRTDRAGSAAS